MKEARHSFPLMKRLLDLRVVDAAERLPIGKGLRFSIIRRALRSSQERVARSYDSDLKKLREQGAKWEEIERIEGNAHFEWSMAEEEIQKMQTRYYISCARDLSVDAHIAGDDWIENPQLGGKCLSLQAIGRLKQAIRKERMDARQEWLAFVPVLGLLAALVAAITGVITVTKEKPTLRPQIILERAGTPL